MEEILIKANVRNVKLKVIKNSDSEILQLINNPATINLGFRKVFAEYKEPLYWYLRKVLYSHEDTDDALQNTFVKVFEKMSSFEGRSSLKTWIFSIAYREALQIIRKNKQLRNGNIENVLGLEDGLLADPYFEGNEIHATLVKAVQHLPDRQRQIFEFRYFEDWPYKDIASMTGLSEGGIKASYHHAVKKIKDYMTENMILK